MAFIASQGLKKKKNELNHCRSESICNLHLSAQPKDGQTFKSKSTTTELPEVSYLVLNPSPGRWSWPGGRWISRKSGTVVWKEKTEGAYHQVSHQPKASRCWKYDVCKAHQLEKSKHTLGTFCYKRRIMKQDEKKPRVHKKKKYNTNHKSSNSQLLNKWWGMQYG